MAGAIVIDAGTDVLAQAAEELLASVAAEAGIPVLQGLQAQGDVLVIPLLMSGGSVSFNKLKPVGPDGQVIVPAGRQGHEHRLFTGIGSEVLYAHEQGNRQRGNEAVIHVTGTAYLLHHGEGFSLGEHQALGIGEGWYVLRRQRERAGAMGSWVRVAD